MSLDKAIEHGKEKRKPYRGAAAWDSHCRPNGSCGYCRNNRSHKNKKRECSCKQELDDLYSIDDRDREILEFWMDRDLYEL